MSRIIKFRAWSKTTKKMIDRVMVGCNKNDDSYVCNTVWSDTEKDWFNFDEFCGEVMQFTGLYDTNCKEIYENDIVIINGHQYLIKFEIGSFMLVRCSGETDMYDQFKECWNDDVYPLSQYYWNDDSEEDAIHSLEIIGNIHENPELLEVI